MILRLIIAFTRWVWGVSPAFVTADSGEWYVAMVFGALIDVVMGLYLIFWLICWIQDRRAK